MNNSSTLVSEMCVEIRDTLKQMYEVSAYILIRPHDGYTPHTVIEVEFVDRGERMRSQYSFTHLSAVSREEARIRHFKKHLIDKIGDDIKKNRMKNPLIRTPKVEREDWFQPILHEPTSQTNQEESIDDTLLLI